MSVDSPTGMGKELRLDMGSPGSPDDPEKASKSSGDGSFFESPNAALAVVFVALFADYLLLTVVIPILPVLLKGKGHSTIATGILFASKAVMQMLANPVWAFITDRHGPRYPLFVGLIVLSLSTLGFALANTYELLLLARCVQGVASAAMMTAGMALISSKFPGEERGEAIGTAIGGIALGVMLGPPAGGLAFADTPLGRGLPFVIVAVVILVDAILQINLSTPREVPPGATYSALSYLRQPMIRYIAIALVTANSGIALVEPIIAPHLHGNFGVPTSLTGIVFLSAPLAYGLSSPLAGKLGDTYDKLTMVTVGLVIVAVSLPCLGLPKRGELELEILALVVLGTGMGFVDANAMPALADICDRQFAGHYGAVFAISDVSFSIGYIIGPFLATLFFDVAGGFLPAVAIPGGIVLVYAVVFYFGTANDWRHRDELASVIEQSVSRGGYKSLSSGRRDSEPDLSDDDGSYLNSGSQVAVYNSNTSVN